MGRDRGSELLKGTSWARSEAGLVESHLMAGFWHYYHVMLYLAEQCGWENKFVLDFSSSSPYGWGFSVEKKKSSDEMEAGMAILVEGAEHR